MGGGDRGGGGYRGGRGAGGARMAGGVWADLVGGWGGGEVLLTPIKKKRVYKNIIFLKNRGDSKVKNYNNTK